jgi:epoxyqueuosine reductase QueG
VEDRFTPREGIVEPKLQELIDLSQEDFSVRFCKSPIKRAKLAGLKRNAEAALNIVEPQPE